MTRNLLLGGIAAIALGFSPFTPVASADWFSEQFDKVHAGESKIRSSYPDYYEKWMAGQQKAWESYLDSLDKIGGIPRKTKVYPYPTYTSPYGYGYFPRVTVPTSPGSLGSPSNR